jgi:hypothetical protein
MKTSLFNELFLCAASPAIGILRDAQAQAQPAIEAWVQRYHGQADSDDRAIHLAAEYQHGHVELGDCRHNPNGRGDDQDRGCQSADGEQILSAQSPVAVGVGP